MLGFLYQNIKRTSCATVLTLAYQSLGVVYGDLSTSPLYVYKTSFSGKLSLKEDDEEIFGVLSFIFWTFTIIALFKYVFIVMSADDNGEGTILKSCMILVLFGLCLSSENILTFFIVYLSKKKKFLYSIIITYNYFYSIIRFLFSQKSHFCLSKWIERCRRITVYILSFILFDFVLGAQFSPLSLVSWDIIMSNMIN